MVRLRRLGPGWVRDLPDTRDFRPDSDALRSLFGALPRSRSARTARPSKVDWREYLIEPNESLALPACLSPARACVAMAQYFERRASGQLIDLSPWFLQAVTQRVTGRPLDEPAGLRDTLKSLSRFGAPPAELWKTAENSPFSAINDPVLFGYAREWRELRYVRLDAPEATGALSLRVVKAFLAAGFVAVFGGVLPELLAANGEIGFPTRHEAATSAQALLVVGYDDQHRWRSHRGALRVRAFFDSDWGEAGCGWLPYRYVEERLAGDFWTLARPDWFASGEFQSLPRE
ncbi:MAG: hypothetical protein JSS27_16255 [Planctomycetes bacterium]|nr:hypothetical protein [Planctomycetota bacterium]